MARVLLILIVVAVVFTVYAVVDCAFFDRRRIRGLPHAVWIVVILLVPVLGGILWFLIGRGRRGRAPARASRTVAPDDDTEFLRRLEKDAAQEERIRKLEDELAKLDDDAPDSGDARHGDPGQSGDVGPGRPNG